MFFSKYPHPANFSYPDSYQQEQGMLQIGGRTCRVEFQTYLGDVARLRVSHEQWGESRTLVPLEPPAEAASQAILLDPDLELKVVGPDGELILSSKPGEGFGVSGEASLFQFQLGGPARFFGMGEKQTGSLEHSGQRVKFWNTDVWGDFPYAQYKDQPLDPAYFSTPYLVVEVGGVYVGFLLDNPSPAFMEVPGQDRSRAFWEWQQTSECLILGSESGEPNLWVLVGPTLRELTRKLQSLVGRTPLPPLWSLGYHQSRWGYEGHDDLMELDRQFSEHQIPCSGLWMDLDYMDGFRIFTLNPSAFPDGPQATADLLARSGRRIVPIIDPGVKKEAGYSVYGDGLANGVFCKNPEGSPYVGLVWPGLTVFPDFTMESARAWWSRHASEFRGHGFGGCWVDMNDPSTGPVDPHGMRFRHGEDDHARHRNQYALGMQMATYAGFLEAKPQERPFILSRSGFTGSSRYAAIWTGDNLSNEFYLRMSIPAAINLSLSGIPFHGPDMGGFGGDAEDDLMIAWFKAGFLFPFFRNHCGRGQRQQEPFAFPEPVMKTLRRYIRLRYKLLPHLYNLFVQHEEAGDPILRPLFYEFEDEDLWRIEDQFLIGADLLQAPFVGLKDRTRSLVLPGSEPWYCAMSGSWVKPCTHTVKARRDWTPLYVRAGAVIPMQPGTPLDPFVDLSKVHLHLFLLEGASDGEARYVADDGLSFDYREGGRSAIELRYTCTDGHLALNWEQTEDGYGAVDPTFVLHGPVRSVRLNGASAPLSRARAVLTGGGLSVQVVG